MRKAICLLLSLALLLGAFPALAESALPAGYDPALAQQLLLIAELCYNIPAQKAMLAKQGFTFEGQYNYDRPAGDARHVAAYTVYLNREQAEPVALIAVRGTGDGEWPLNLEVMPSGNYDLPYAENFRLAAEDVLSTQAELLEGLENPRIVVTGHSRGAAVANVLGALLSDRYGQERVVAYTFAAPRTVRGEYPAYANIYNVINPADLVPYLPLYQWGFARYGTDILLPVEEEALAEAVQAAYDQRTDQMGELPQLQGVPGMVENLANSIAQAVPDLEVGCTVRHSLKHPGPAEEGEEGITGQDFLMALMTGSLRSGGIPPELAKAAAAANDMTPIVSAIMVMVVRKATVSMAMAHMPAVYGAWMTAMEKD